jgi:hypothetical protein
MLKSSFPGASHSHFLLSERGCPRRKKQKQMIRMEMNMKKIISSAFVALVLVGSVATASAAPEYSDNNFPGPHSSLSETLNFWAQFSDDNN